MPPIKSSVIASDVPKNEGRVTDANLVSVSAALYRSAGHKKQAHRRIFSKGWRYVLTARSRQPVDVASPLAGFQLWYRWACV